MNEQVEIMLFLAFPEEGHPDTLSHKVNEEKRAAVRLSLLLQAVLHEIAVTLKIAREECKAGHPASHLLHNSPPTNE